MNSYIELCNTIMQLKDKPISMIQNNICCNCRTVEEEMVKVGIFVMCKVCYTYLFDELSWNDLGMILNFKRDIKVCAKQET